jgi:hypothetical protein
VQSATFPVADDDIPWDASSDGGNGSAIRILGERTGELVGLLAVFLFTLGSISMMPVAVYRLLAAADRDSLMAMILLTVICFLAIGLLSQVTWSADNSAVLLLWIPLCAVLLPLLAHIVFLVAVRQCALSSAFSSPRGDRSSPFLVNPLRRTKLSIRPVFNFSLVVARLLLWGCLFWIPILLVSFLSPGFASLFALVVAIAYRKRVSSPIWEGYHEMTVALQRGAQEVLARDKRAHILFLRAFAVDELRSDNLSSRVASAIFGPDTSSQRLEECLVDALYRLGPIVALTRPNSETGQLGAARISPQGDWKQLVADLSMKAQLIVMVYGGGEGLRWEMNHLKAHGLLHRTMIVIPPIYGFHAEVLLTEASKHCMQVFASGDNLAFEPSLEIPPRVVLQPAGEASPTVVVSKRGDVSAYLLAARYAANSLVRSLRASPALVST